MLWDVGIKLHVGHQGLPCPCCITEHSDAIEHMKDVKDGLEAQRTLKLGEVTEGFDAGGHVTLVEENARDSSDTPNNCAPNSTAQAHNRQNFSADTNIDVPAMAADPDIAAEIEDPLEDESEWEDIPKEYERTSSIVPDEDECGNRSILIVDVAGLIKLPVVWCHCPDADDILQLIDLELFPASFKDIQTVFTFNVLKDFRLSNLECKTSGYQYFQKLRRVSNSAFPHQVPNRYVELRRVSRQWRNISYLRWNGFGHLNNSRTTSNMANVPRDEIDGQSSETPGACELALFCPTCPQPGINLPDNWRTCYVPYAFALFYLSSSDYH